MIRITNSIDQDKMEFVFKIECNFFKKYFSNFVGYLNKQNNVFERDFDIKDYSVERLSDNTIKLGFPLPDGAINMTGSNGVAAVKVPNVGPIVEKVINTFTNKALNYELLHTEFIPLSGYPLKDLQEDVKKSVSGKRNLCVLKTYDEYLKSEKDHKYEFNQLMVDYGTNDWADIVLLILDGDMDALREMCSHRLKLEEWF